LVQQRAGGQAAQHSTWPGMLPMPWHFRVVIKTSSYHFHIASVFRHQEAKIWRQKGAARAMARTGGEQASQARHAHAFELHT